MSPAPHRLTRIAALLLSFAWIASPTFAADAQDKKKDESAGRTEPSAFLQATSRKPATSPGKVYTNDDLRRLFGGATVQEVEGGAAADPSAASTGAGQPSAQPQPPTLPDPLQQMADRNRQQQELAGKVSEAQAKLTAAQQRVTDLEQRAKAIRNPYLALPKDAPDGADETARKEWTQLGTAGRLQSTESSLAKAREDVAAAQAELDRLRRSGS